jgi:hypothetical protein
MRGILRLGRPLELRYLEECYEECYETAINEPLGIIACGSIGALVSKLRDSGFKNDQLEQLGKSLQPSSSAIVVEIVSDAIDTAKELLEPCGAQNFVVEDLDENVASLFAHDEEPDAEPEPAATSSDSSS